MYIYKHISFLNAHIYLKLERYSDFKSTLTLKNKILKLVLLHEDEKFGNLLAMHGYSNISICERK